MSTSGTHRPRVYLTRTPYGTPYKWRGMCGCGWECVSWQWQRDDGSGAYPMAFEHAASAYNQQLFAGGHPTVSLNERRQG